MGNYKIQLRVSPISRYNKEKILILPIVGPKFQIPHKWSCHFYNRQTNPQQTTYPFFISALKRAMQRGGHKVLQDLMIDLKIHSAPLFLR